MQKKIILFGFLFFILIFVSFEAYQFFYSGNIKNKGIKVIPSQEIKIIDTLNYDFNPDSFPNAKVSANKLKNSTACYEIKNVIQYLGKNCSYTKLDSAFSRKDAYKSNGELNWKKIEEIFPGYSYYKKQSFSNIEIENALKINRIPIVSVKQKSRKEIYTRIIGSNKLRFISSGNQSLSDFQNTIFGLWIIYPTDYRNLDQTKK